MKVLVDECAPRALKDFLTHAGHECLTVQKAGWSGKQNGELLVLAENKFDVFVTVDTNLRYQQSLMGRKIGVVIINARSNRLAHLSPHFPACAKAIQSIRPGAVVTVGETDD
jgi:predicted nuclease of predicted toxin-antitoxin system